MHAAGVSPLSSTDSMRSHMRSFASIPGASLTRFAKGSLARWCLTRGRPQTMDQAQVPADPLDDEAAPYVVEPAVWRVEAHRREVREAGRLPADRDVMPDVGKDCSDGIALLQTEVASSRKLVPGVGKGLCRVEVGNAGPSPTLTSTCRGPPTFL